MEYDILKRRERKGFFSKVIGFFGMSVFYPIGALLFLSIIGIPFSIPVFAIGSVFQNMFMGRTKQVLVINDKKDLRN